MAIIHERIIEQAEPAVIHDIAVGAFWIAVLAGDPPRCGLASLLRPEYTDHGMLPKIHYPLQRQNAEAIIRLFLSSDTVEAGIGLAALNALIPINADSCIKRHAADMILEESAGKDVVVVGHFPFVEDLRHTASECHVLELKPRDGDLPAEQAPYVLPDAEIAIFSSTTLMNNTFDMLCSLCRNTCTLFMVGGSTPLTPVLFNSGVDHIAGTVIDDPVAAFMAVRQGARFPQIPGRIPVIMSRSDLPEKSEEK